jgi:RNA polymerase sigma-70 factor (ECF subfamily)
VIQTGDRTLINNVINRVPGASDLFVDRFSKFVYSVLHRNLGVMPDVADDLHNLVFLRLFDDGCKRLRNWSQDGNFVNYLGTIVRNLANDHFRKLTVRRELSLELPDGEDDTSWAIDPVSTDPSPEEEAEAAQMRARLYEAMDQLSERDREILRLRHFEEKSYKQIADEMGYKISSVGVLLARAEKRLKEIIDNFLRGDGLAPAG